MFNSEQLKKSLGALFLPNQIWVAYSGGLDSHVLLHGLARLRDENLDLNVRALHVNHNLSLYSKEWSEHCMSVCDQLGVECLVRNVDLSAILAGASPENAARIARYHVFSEVLSTGECLLTAHTQNDQAETVFLRLLRSAGPLGLSGIPTKRVLGKGIIARPLLNFTKDDLISYARSQKLTWVEDESNRSPLFDRNYLRLEIFPLLKTHWSNVNQAMASSAEYCREAVELLDELAIADLKESQGMAPHTLSIPSLKKLSAARQRNLLRFWLRSLNFPLPNEAKLKGLQHDFLYSSHDANPEMTWKDTEIRRYNNELYAISPLLPHDPSLIIPFGNDLTIRFRRGGERFCPSYSLQSHSLKKLFQEWKVPPWQRDRIPLIYFNEDLVAVIGYGTSNVSALLIE